MAIRPHFYAEDNTAVSSSTDNLVVLSIPGSSLKAVTKYLLVARALFGGSSATGIYEIRVATGDTGLNSVLAKSLHKIEPEQTGSGALTSYFYVHSFGTSASPADVNLRIASSTGTAEVDQMSLFLLDLDAIGTEGTDYFEDIQDISSDEYSRTADTTVLAQILGSDMGTAEHLILGSARCDIANTGHYFDHSLHAAYDTSTAVVRSRHRAEGEDNAEQRISGHAIRHKASSGTPNATLFGARQDAGGGAHTDGGAYLIALPTSLFADFVHDYEAGSLELNTTESTVALIENYTPTVTGNHLIIGRVNGSVTPTQLGRMWVEDLVGEIRTGDSVPSHNQIWDDSKDEEMMATFQRISITDEKTYGIRSVGANADFDIEHRWLLVVNLDDGVSADPVAVYPPFPRHQKPTVRM